MIGCKKNKMQTVELNKANLKHAQMLATDKGRRQGIGRDIIESWNELDRDRYTSNERELVNKKHEMTKKDEGNNIKPSKLSSWCWVWQNIMTKTNRHSTRRHSKRNQPHENKHQWLLAKMYSGVRQLTVEQNASRSDNVFKYEVTGFMWNQRPNRLQMSLCS